MWEVRVWFRIGIYVIEVAEDVMTAPQYGKYWTNNTEL
jgi:hypothetical protein